MAEAYLPARCRDCGLPYADFPLDTILPDKDWLLIHPEGEGGLLCAGCIAKRVAKLPKAIVLYARIIFDDEHDAWAAGIRAQRTQVVSTAGPPTPRIVGSF